MSIVAKRVIEALVAGKTLRLGEKYDYPNDTWTGKHRVVVDGTDLIYRGRGLAEYWTSFFDKDDHHISFTFHPDHIADPFVMALIEEAMLWEGCPVKVDLKSHKLQISNGVWAVVIPMVGWALPTSWMKRKMKVPQFEGWTSRKDTDEHKLVYTRDSDGVTVQYTGMQILALQGQVGDWEDLLKEDLLSRSSNSKIVG